MKRHHLIGLLLAACAWPAANVCADVITYTVDPTRSSLTISGTYEGDPLQPQPGVAGSLTTSYTGTITADRDFIGNMLEITGGSIDAQTDGGVSASGADDYAFTGLSGHFGGSVVGFTFSISGPAIGFPSSFDISQLLATIGSGEIDTVSGGSGGGGRSFGLLPMTGTLALTSGPATLAEIGGIETLT